MLSCISKFLNLDLRMTTGEFYIEALMFIYALIFPIELTSTFADQSLPKSGTECSSLRTRKVLPVRVFRNVRTQCTMYIPHQIGWCPSRVPRDSESPAQRLARRRPPKST
jgi:hypothetical protein